MTRPPRWPLTFLRWWGPAAHLQEIEGDLQELFELRVRESGRWHARRRYCHDVLSVLVRAHQVQRFRRAHEARGARMSIIRQIINELRFSARALGKRPAYACVAALTLALGL